MSNPSMTLDQYMGRPHAAALVRRIRAGPPGLFLSSGPIGSGKAMLLWVLAQEQTFAGQDVTWLLEAADTQARNALLPQWKAGTIQRGGGWTESFKAACPNTGLVVFPELGPDNTRDALELARTGRWVFASVDTPFVGLDVLHDLERKGASVEQTTAVVRGIVSQMLADRLCKSCAAVRQATAEEARLLGVNGSESEKIWDASGCAECNQRGTSGRLALQEIFMLDDAVRPSAVSYLVNNNFEVNFGGHHMPMQDAAREHVRSGSMSVSTYRRQVFQNPLLRSQHLLERERDRATQIKRLFGRFVSHSVAERMISSDVEALMQGERKFLTCMFADVRGFTSLSERLTPADIFSLLNVYFGKIITTIFKYEGTIDKFIGDSIMVIFGAPVDQTDHASRAVRCAIEIQSQIREINAQTRQHSLGMGIGINTGYAIAGCLGSHERSDYTVIGDTVNTAQRIESQSGAGKILIGPGTYEEVKALIECRSLGQRQLKGKAEPVEIFEVPGGA